MFGFLIKVLPMQPSPPKLLNINSNEFYPARRNVEGARANELAKAAIHYYVHREGESNRAKFLLCLRVA